MSAAAHHGHAPSKAPYYFVPSPSSFPVLASVGLFFVVLGAGQWVNGHGWGAYSLAFGLVFWAYVLQGWFRAAIGESEGGLYSDRIDVSFRWSMSWFIFSEVMFFGAFFGALYWARLHAVPNLGSIENALLWPDFKAVWPSSAPGATASPAGIVEPFATLLDQFHEDGLAVRLLEIERDRPLVAMQVLEVGTVARPAHVHLTGRRRHLDLDAVGAPVGKVADGRRTGAHARQVEDFESG